MTQSSSIWKIATSRSIFSTPVRDIVHDVDEEGRPTRVHGIKTGAREEFRAFDAVIAACDVPGIKKVLPASFRKYEAFDKIYNLDTVPIATVQVRFDGWVTRCKMKRA
jgi:zeta-carotene desaturase